MLRLALSPYHLATREAPAMAALILADRVVTLMPQPVAGATRTAVRAAVNESPHYLRLMESWRWSSPLWTAGLISSGIDGDESSGELPGVYQSIAEEDELASLRPLTRGAEERAAQSAAKSLDHMAADLLRGGPDPGINIPVCAALDRFAQRHDLCVVRSGISSIAQRAEARMGTRLFSVAIPILMRAGGGRIQLLRNDLHLELSALREAIAEVLGAVPGSGASGPQLASRVDELHAAAEAYSAAFAAWAPTGAKGDDENAQRITTGFVSLTAKSVPADAILRSSRAAIRALVPHGHHSDEVSACDDRLVALVVREMSLRPE
ncbi:MAG TPA: hypothetical protein PKE29_00675 [Phycisphaerales bacterium]|nr:hypothetical protein [Phycisphaerales bacterium]